MPLNQHHYSGYQFFQINLLSQFAVKQLLWRKSPRAVVIINLLGDWINNCFLKISTPLKPARWIGKLQLWLWKSCYRTTRQLPRRTWTRLNQFRTNHGNDNVNTKKMNVDGCHTIFNLEILWFYFMPNIIFSIFQFKLLQAWWFHYNLPFVYICFKWKL